MNSQPFWKCDNLLVGSGLGKISAIILLSCTILTWNFNFQRAPLIKWCRISKCLVPPWDSDFFCHSYSWHIIEVDYYCFLFFFLKRNFQVNLLLMLRLWLIYILLPLMIRLWLLAIALMSMLAVLTFYDQVKHWSQFLEDFYNTKKQ